MDTRYFISILFIFTAVISTAQSIQLSYQGDILNNGEQIYLLGESTANDLEIGLMVSNISNSTKAIGCYRYEIDTISQSAAYMCWANCTVLPDGGIVNLEPNESSDLFSAHMNPNGHFGVERSLYTFFDTNNPSDSMSFMATFVTSDFVLVDDEDYMIHQEVELFGVVGETIHYSFPYIENRGTTETSIGVIQHLMEMSPGSEVVLNWNDIEYPGEITADPFPFFPGVNSSSFAVELHSGDSPGISSIRYTFFEDANFENAQQLTLIFNTTGVGMNELRGMELKAYPNPSHGHITIEYQIDQLNNNPEIEILDVLGRVILKSTLTEANRLHIKLQQGQYYYRIHTDQGYTPAKMIFVI